LAHDGTVNPGLGVIGLAGAGFVTATAGGGLLAGLAAGFVASFAFSFLNVSSARSITRLASATDSSAMRLYKSQTEHGRAVEPQVMQEPDSSCRRACSAWSLAAHSTHTNAAATRATSPSGMPSGRLIVHSFQHL